FRHKALNSRDAREGAPPNTTIHIRPVGVNLVRSTLDGCIVVRSMSSSIIVLGWPVRPIPASLIPAGTPVFLANCYTQNRVIQRSYCAAAIQSLACLLRVNGRLQALSRVRLTPQSRHREFATTCLLRANKRHTHCSKLQSIRSPRRRGQVESAEFRGPARGRS